MAIIQGVCHVVSKYLLNKKQIMHILLVTYHPSIRPALTGIWSANEKVNFLAGHPVSLTRTMELSKNIFGNNKLSIAIRKQLIYEYT